MKHPNWIVLDRLIINSELSLRAIADDHGITEGGLRKRIKARGLVRNLGKRIKSRADEKLAEAVTAGLARAERESPAKIKAREGRRKTVGFHREVAKEVKQALDASAASAEERQVEDVATAVATIIGHHRVEAHQAQQLVARLVADLTAAANHRIDLAEIIDNDDGDGRSRLNMLAAIALPSHAKAAAQLVAALNKAQEIARRAWGINDETLPAPPVEDEDESLVRDIRALAIAWNAAEPIPTLLSMPRKS